MLYGSQKCVLSTQLRKLLKILHTEKLASPNTNALEPSDLKAMWAGSGKMPCSKKSGVQISLNAG